MRKALNDPKVVGILCVLAVIAVYFNVMGPSLGQPDPAGAPPSPSASAAGPAVAPPPQAAVPAGSPPPESGAGQKPAKADISEMGWPERMGRDPFAPPPGTPARMTRRQGMVAQLTSIPLQLDAVAADVGGRLAVINQRIVEEGEQIAGYRVVRIHPDEVTVEGPRGRERLEFVEGKKEGPEPQQEREQEEE